MSDINKKTIDEIRKEFLFTNASYTNEEINIIYEKILEEEKLKNPKKFKEAYDKLNSILNVEENIPFEINKEELYEFVRQQLLDLKALVIAFRMNDVEFRNPVSTLKDIEVYTILYNYLKNDSDLNIEDSPTKSR